jgi:hypothetical protein
MTFAQKKIVIIGTLIWAAGCSKSEDAKELEIFPPKIFTGYDGVDSYQAPVITVNHSGNVTWTIADASLATLQPEGDGHEMMITAKKAGETTVTATNGSSTSTATLKIYSYTRDENSDGKRRYTTNIDADSPACSTCHAPGIGPDHTPTEIDADPDEEIANTFLTGIDPEGRSIRENSEFGVLLGQKNHVWKVPESQTTGLISYMRSLAPKGYPEYDEPTTKK